MSQPGPPGRLPERFLTWVSRRRRVLGAPGPYDAFISHRNVVDELIAAALRDGLHRFAKPSGQTRALRVYVDRSNLSMSPGIWPQIEAALAASRYLILLASPEAVRSDWVTREVGYWLDNKPSRNLLIFVTGGDIAWDPVAGDFDPDRTTALSANLFGRFEDQPVWTDLRWARQPDRASYENAAFKDVVGTLAATLHGRPKDELVGEDVRQQARSVRFRRAVRAGFALLTVLVAIAAIVAWQQRGEALRNEALAQERARVAVSRQLAAEAARLLATDPNLAKQLSIVAYRTAPTHEAATELLNNVGAPGAIAVKSPQPPANAVFSPNGRVLAIAAADDGVSGSVRLWDMHTHRVIASLPGHGADLSAMAFAADGNTIASGDKEIRLWNVSDPHHPHLLGEFNAGPEPVTALAYEQDGALLAVGGGQSVQLWQVVDQHRPTMLGVLPTGPGEVNRLQFSSDGKRLAGSDNDTVRLWDVSRPDRPAELAVLADRQQDYAAATFAWHGNTLARSDGPGRIRLWDVSGPGQPVAISELTHSHDGVTSNVTALAFSRDGGALASVIAGDTLLWNFTDPAQPNPVPANLGEGGGARAITFTPDGDTLATVDHVVHLWDTTNPTRPRSLATMGSANSYSTALAFTPDGKVLAEASFGLVRLWDVTRSRAPSQLATFGAPSQGLTTLAYDRRGRVLAVASDDTLRLWDVTNPRTPAVLATRTMSNVHLQAVAISPDSEVLVTVSNDADKPNVTTDDQGDRRIRVWDITDPAAPAVAATLDGGPDGSVIARADASFAPTERTFAVTQVGGEVSLWDAATPPRPRRLTVLDDRIPTFVSTGARVAFSANGHHVAKTAIDGSVRLWHVADPRQPQPVGTLSQASFPGGAGSILEFSITPARHVLATSVLSTVRLWDVREANAPIAVATLTSNVNSVAVLAFAPDGQTLVTGNGDGTVDLRTTDPTDAAELICATAGSPITDAEWTRYAPDIPHDQPCQH